MPRPCLSVAGPVRRASITLTPETMKQLQELQPAFPLAGTVSGLIRAAIEAAHEGSKV